MKQISFLVHAYLDNVIIIQIFHTLSRIFVTYVCFDCDQIYLRGLIKSIARHALLPTHKHIVCRIKELSISEKGRDRICISTQEIKRAELYLSILAPILKYTLIYFNYIYLTIMLIILCKKS